MTTCRPRAWPAAPVLLAAWRCLLALTVLAGSVAAQEGGEAEGARRARVVVGGGDNYKPFHYVSDGSATGFDVELTRAIGRVMDLDVDVRLDYWADIRDDLADGEVQVHVGMTHSPDRAERFRFTTPYLNQQYKIFVADDASGIRDEDDLWDKRIIVQKSGVMEDYVRRRGYTDAPILAPTAAEALRKLVLGEGDCCLMTEFRGITVAQDLGLETVRRVGDPVYQTTYGFAVIPKREDLVLTLNQGLALLKRSGEYDRIYTEWFGVLAEQEPSTGDYLRFAAWIVAPLVVVLLMAALWSYSLRRQVIRQTAELRRARDQAETASEAKSRFLATISHEIRTPLNGVLGMVQLLQGSVLDRPQQQQVGTIQRSAVHLQGILDDILEFSRIDAGERQLDRLDFSFRDLVSDVLDLLAPAAWAKGLVLERDLAADLPDRVVGDPTAVRQVLTSLVGNGIKFTDQGVVTLGLRGERGGAGRVRVRGWVDDTGVGVPESDRERLFEAFTQADSSSTRRHGGTGLGLAICDHLTRLMQGHVSHEPRAGGGSRFRFVIELEAVEAPAPRAPAPSTPDAADVAGQPILVVDDDPTNQRVVCLLLEKWGYRCRVAANGQEAVDAFLDDGPAAVIMDCQMPVMDGLEATRRIRKLESGDGHVPIVALTAGADMSSRDRCLAVGMDDYLTKPLSAARLRETIAGQLASTAPPVPTVS